MVCIHGKINDKSIHYAPNLYSLLYSKKNVLLCLPVLPVRFSIKPEAIPNNRSRNTYHTVYIFPVDIAENKLKVNIEYKTLLPDIYNLQTVRNLGFAFY